MDKNPLIVALDVADWKEATSLVLNVKEKIKIFKVGLELFLACGREIVDFIQKQGCNVFLDLKFFDIPNQVAGAVREISAMNVEMFTVHILGGSDMMKRVVSVVNEAFYGKDIAKPKILGVTLLTSFNQSDIISLGFTAELTKQ
ncbi:MAG: orotidine-5'-phosphate decarboxylase, partial [Candidatus Subteraquimicrobiales bacterium]|nr:orotidine-5'-phosphate decarboxylase [Candidatus Subteraquimicrobiales bacterium]